MFGPFGQQDLLMGLDVGFEDKREPRGHSAFGEGGQVGVAFNGDEKDWSQRRFWGKDRQFSFREIKCGAPLGVLVEPVSWFGPLSLELGEKRGLEIQICGS